MKKIVILYLLTGIGHYREAVAISVSLKRLGFDPELVYPFEYYKNSSSLTFKVVNLLYDFFIWLWEIFSRFDIFSNTKGLTRRKSVNFYQVKVFTLICKACARFFGRSVASSELFDNCEAVISTHPLTSIFALEYKKKRSLSFKVLNVVPDEVGISAGQYFHVENCTNLVNSLDVKELFVDHLNGDAKEIHVIGHPVHPDLYKNRKKIFDRVQKSFTEKKIVLGLYIGLFKPEQQQKALINTLRELSAQIKQKKLKVKILTCGHEGFERRLSKIIAQGGLSNFLDIHSEKDRAGIVEKGMRWLLDDVNVIFSRPSELVFYSLTCGTPHILFDPVGPQEVDMAALLRSKADVRMFRQLKGTLYHYLCNTNKLKKISSDLYKSGYLLGGATEVSKFL